MELIVRSIPAKCTEIKRLKYSTVEYLHIINVEHHVEYAELPFPWQMGGLTHSYEKSGRTEVF